MPELSIEVEVRELPLKERFTIARQTWDSSTNVFVIARYGDAVGLGEVGPADRWGESVESVVRQLEEVDLSRLNGPFDLEGVATLLPAGSARCALDVALHDLASTIAGVPLRDFLGLAGRPIPPTSITIPITEVDKMVERAKGFVDHPIIKIKVGFDGDVEAVRALRDSFPGKIRIDANEGWGTEEAIERLNALDRFDIELCEQPIRGGNLGDLARITARSPIAVFADEDVGESKDVAKLVGVVDGVNLKLRKAGGIRELVKGVHTARAHGMKVMLGCDLDSGVQTGAGAAIASLMDHVDLDGPLLLADDPFPSISYDKGTITLPDRPGIGVSKDAFV
ncbi:MAG: dipeptide epimerase [Actinobacteria bacterium]|nr:dipeptide epimerase [Actinomycetota bacterium]